MPEAAEWARAWPAQFEQQTQLSWPKLLASLGGELGLAITLDESRKISLPTGRNTIDLPAPAILLAVKVKDDLLYERIARDLTNNPQTTVTSEGGLKMCAMPLPIPLPLPLQIVIATSGDYFFFATSADLVRTAMQVRQGKQPGLKKSADFQNLAKHLPAEGNQFFYVSPTFGETIATIQKQAMRDSGLPAEQVTRLQRFFTGGTMAYSLSVGAHTSTGWHSTSVGNQDSAKALALVPVAVTAVGAGMLLPALAKAKSRAQAINSVNQLKQIGLAARIYASDHQDKYPPAETWCEVLKDSLGGNVSVYKAPSDPSSGRCSYAYNAKLSGRDEGQVNPQTVMFFETTGGWNQHGGRGLMITTPRNSGVFVVGFADGSVQQISPARVGSLRWDP